MKAIIAVAALLFATLSFATKADERSPTSARELYESCKHTIEKLEEGPKSLVDPTKVHRCLYYIMGAADIASTMTTAKIHDRFICVPKNYVFQTVAREIVALGVRYPGFFDESTSAGQLAGVALMESYGSKEPCSTTQSAGPTP